MKKKTILNPLNPSFYVLEGEILKLHQCCVVIQNQPLILIKLNFEIYQKPNLFVFVTKRIRGGLLITPWRGFNPPTTICNVTIR